MLCKMRIYICLLAGIIFRPEAYGQYKLEQPVMIGSEQGLPTNDIRAIKKGKDGFIWMGTAEGLCRFDGQQAKMFRPGENSKTVSFDNTVNTVLPLGNEVWMGTNQGITVLSTPGETFRYYQFDEKGKSATVERRFNQAVAVLYQDAQGNIWVGTRDKGLWVYDKAKDDFKKFDYPAGAYKAIIPALASNNSILSIEASGTNDSVIWAGTPAGLQEVNKYNGRVTWYTFPQNDKDHQVPLNAFRKLYHHEDGLLYVGSWGAGVNVFDPVTKNFTPLVCKEDIRKEIFSGPIGNILQKSKDELWITTSRGLAIYNTRQQAVTWHKLNQPLKGEFYGVEYIDEANRIWQTNINGVQYFDPAVQQFSTWSFEHLFNKEWAYAFYIIPDLTGDHLTVCPRIADGLFHFDKRNTQWTKSPFQNLAMLGQERITVRGFVEIAAGRYLISADEGMFMYSLKTKILSVVPDQPPISFKRWGEVLKDYKDNLWFSADADGLVKWNLATGQYRIYKKELSKDRTGLGFGRPNYLFEDSRHNIWFSRSDGFSVYLPATDSIINFLYSVKQENSFPFVNNFAEDRNGRVWVSSGDGWYGYIDVRSPGNGLVQKFDLKTNNISGHLTDLAADKEGNVWGFTEKELVRINVTDMSLSTFSFAYGVRSVDFFHFSFLPDGEMVFGGRNSITLADPAELKRNTEMPAPYIMQLKLLNHDVSNALYANAGTLRLNYRQNFITIFFSAQAYTMPKGVRFRYQLKSFDEWIEVKDSRLANYTNIPPGDYVFQLQAANNEGVWNEAMLELPIHIATPWWQTWWFQTGAVLLVTGLTYWLYRYRISQVKKKEKLKTQYEKKLANVEMTALLAQMNPHFLFNSLNSIDSYIIKNESGKASEYLNNFARLMRLILQNSRSNYTSLKDEIEALDLYLQMEGLRFKDKFQYEIKIADGLDTGSIVIPPMLIQPYVENAIWHGLMHKKDGTVGKVEIIISQQDNKLVCIVQDNGIGREKADAIKAQKPGNHKRSMGMQITRDRMDMINKLYNTNTSVRIVDLKDMEGNPAGTRVEIILPF